MAFLNRSVLIAIGNAHFQSFRLLHGHIRGKPPGTAKSLKERIDEMNYQEEIFTYKVDIGLPGIKRKRSQVMRERINELTVRRKSPELAKLARNYELIVDLNEVQEEWLKTGGPLQIKTIATHYGIYEHLYGEGYFFPRVPMDIHFEQDDGILCPVHYGNVVKPLEAAKAPLVKYPSGDSDMWSLLLTSLDGNFTDNDKEYIHWFVANIPGNELDKGQTLVKYLQPIPPRGTGYHRYAFVLYKQTKPIKFSILPGDRLNDRTFQTREWYSKHQEDITPAGLAFFQSDWDHSLTDFFHNELQMKEPVFEYDFPKPYIKPQRWFPLKMPFNIYMDRYRDKKQINKEYLERILKDVHPFEKPKPPLKYPNAQPLPKSMPSWLKVHEEKIRLGQGRINDVLYNDEWKL